MLFYRLILSALLWPWLTLRLAWRLWRGSPDSTLDERWMRDRPAPAHARRIWVHAASNGELTAVRAALLALLARAPGLHLVLTCNTTNGRDLVAGWADPRIDARLAPVDLRPILARFVDIFQPAALVIVENELWPERLLTCHGRGLPVLVIGARMGPKSHRLWSRLPALARRLMGTITWLAPQDGASRDRFADLGLPGHRIGRDLVLKSAAATAPMPAASSSGAAALPFARTYTVLAASTHEGEEEIVLDAFIRARRQLPDLHLILAPRHPRRRNAIEAAIRSRGLAFDTRSRGAEPAARTPVYLADTLGEMDRWYAAAGMTFVGGSLVPRGGHAPFEPAAHGSAILHGPDVTNSAPAYAALAAAGAAREIENCESLAAALLELADPARQAARAAAARQALAAFNSDAALGAFFDALSRATGIPEPARDPKGNDDDLHA